MKGLKNFSCLLKVAAKDYVDMIVIVFFVAFGFIDLFTEYDFTGGLLFFAVYAFTTLLRMAWWKLVAINHIEDDDIRKKLKIPNKKEDCL